MSRFSQCLAFAQASVYFLVGALMSFDLYHPDLYVVGGFGLVGLSTLLLRSIREGQINITVQDQREGVNHGE